MSSVLAAGRRATALISRPAALLGSMGAMCLLTQAPGRSPGRAVAQLLSLKELPQDEADRSPTLARFSNGPVYMSSFRLTQRDMFESVKRVTGTTEDDGTIAVESPRQRWEDAQAELKQGNMVAFYEDAL